LFCRREGRPRLATDYDRTDAISFGSVHLAANFL
jgi:hypothetical protein